MPEYDKLYLLKLLKKKKKTKMEGDTVLLLLHKKSTSLVPISLPMNIV